MKKSHIKELIIVGAIVVCALFVFVMDRRGSFASVPFGVKKNIVIETSDEKTTVPATRMKTVCEILYELKLKKKSSDKVTPDCDTELTNDMEISVTAQKVITLVADGSQKALTHYGGETFEEVARRNGVEIGEYDIVTPDDIEIVTDNMQIKIIRVRKEEVIEREKIPFEENVTKNTQKESGFEEIKEQGRDGEKEVTYNITYHDGEEVSKEKISEKITKEKVDAIVIKGVEKSEEEVSFGKSHTGQASWYAYKDCDCAANPWLPKGSRVKVTAVNSGRSVIVTINDRGPFVPGRIIDLDVTAFEKIAPKGAGVIDVKMEEIVE